jgi:hypothetical protein
MNGVAGSTYPDWDSLTRIPLKAELYRRETYFREGMRSAALELGQRLSRFHRDGALLVVKPDGLAAGKAAAVVEFLRTSSFAVVGVASVTYSRFHWRELWRYQLTCATLDRLALNDFLLCDRGLALLLRDESGARTSAPATVRLAGLKGPADVSRQTTGCLRRVLGQPNRVLSFVHVADEPADVLRELAILCEEPERRRLFAAYDRGSLAPEEASVLESEVERSRGNVRSVELRSALDRLEGALRGASGAETALELLGRIGRRESVDWRVLQAAVTAVDAPVDRWDLAVLGSWIVQCDEPDVPKTIGNVDRELWEGRGERALCLQRAEATGGAR